MNDPFGGIEPPSEPLRLPSYSSNISHPCITCSKMHNTILEEMATGKVLERFDQCRDCLMNSWFESCKKHWDTAKIDISLDRKRTRGLG